MVFGAPGGEMEMRAHLPQKPFGAGEADLLSARQQAAFDQIGEAVGAIEIFGDPEQSMEVTQTALAILDIGLQQIA